MLSCCFCLDRPNTGKTPRMFQQICEHLGQMSNVGFSTQTCWCVNDPSSLSEVFIHPDWQLCVNRWKWQGGCKALVWTSRLGRCLYKRFKKILSAIWLWLYDMTVQALWKWNLPLEKIEVWSPKVCLWFMSPANTTHMFTSVWHSWWNRPFLADGRKKV